MDDKFFIDLHAMPDPYFGLIVPHSGTGCVYTNQVGGHLCAHPRVEGFYVPLPTRWKPLGDPLYNFAQEYDEEPVKDRVVDFLEASDWCDKYFKPLDSYHNHYLREAWIPVEVKDPEDLRWFPSMLRPLVGKIVILTYANSD